ncbi:ribosome small subunit-dependent GTPase A [Desulfotomaculum sp. 1211_IL3151]|uniref:ribosome small subunit-dependent GTPase A n=1 Tax=Desulfotomaculum sp. 1211_IL3151 TaxID=3084055 RepID=UPI002FDADEA8
MFHKDNLKSYGISERFLQEATLYPDLVLGRICSQYKDLYKAVTPQGEVFAEVSGRFRYGASRLSDYPAVGDFVMLDRSMDEGGNAIIHQVLTRKSSFERKAVGMEQETQVVAANIDTVFLCMALNQDYNLRRLERYLSIAWDSRALPVVVLTKADLCPNLEEKMAEVSSVAIGVDVLVTSAMSGDGYGSIRSYVQPGKTVALIGSSGVGKSTLINRLAGEELLQTNDIRKDDKGRHTTTRRELLVLQDGGIVIDTPGMRELGLENADLARAFSDIDRLAEQCKFRDCSHRSEPGCAIQRAIQQGTITRERLDSYLKLKKEAGYEGLTSKQIETEKINRMFSGMGGMKNARKFIQEQSKKKR